MKRTYKLLCLSLISFGMSQLAFAAGTLKPVGAVSQDIRIQNHQVKVTINNGFARTEVTQTFHNPNDKDLEGIYVCPVPRSASLAEYELLLSEETLQGEVVSREQAEAIYGKAKSEGEDAGLAKKDPFDTFRFAVSPIPAGGEVTVRFVYYQPIEIDTGVGRYVYALEDGGTDVAATSFWNRQEKVDHEFRFDLVLKSGWPVEEVRLPGYENQAIIDQLENGHYEVSLIQQGASLNKDIVFYYRLAENLPGRVELLTHKEKGAKEGTFMMVLTPGIDLAPLQNGSDYIFVLDISGSMQGKMGALIEGVKRGLGTLSGQDRFAIVLFDDRAENLTRGWVAATPAGVQSGLELVGKIKSRGGTNLHAGLNMALGELEQDRTTTLILVTDAVTNRGEINPLSFYKLMQNHDIRFFGFLMGNNANWPLMSVLTEASGGTYARISGSDDLVGQVLLAKSKITSQAMHDSKLFISGVPTNQIVGEAQVKIFRGQQWVIFGRYQQSGEAQLSLKTRISGVDKTYKAPVSFPAESTDHPELERLWALATIEQQIVAQQCGFVSTKDMKKTVQQLGIDYQLVTDYTSMIVLRDAKFEEYGVQRKNKQRIEKERQAQAFRAASGPQNNQADSASPMFSDPAPTLNNGGGSGGGALNPWWALVIIVIPVVFSNKKTGMF